MFHVEHSSVSSCFPAMFHVEHWCTTSENAVFAQFSSLSSAFTGSQGLHTNWPSTNLDWSKIQSGSLHS